MKEIIINSLTEYVEAILSVEESKINTLCLENELFYRGLSNTAYNLEPSLGRQPGGCWMNTFQMLEIELVEAARKKFPMLFCNNDYPVLLLAKLQHYGIPTRMMDVTANSLVALYFACQHGNKETNNSDGVVYVIEGIPFSPYNPIANAIADTYRLTRNALMELEMFAYKLIQQDYYKPYLYDANINTIANQFIDATKHPIIVDAGDFCERQKNQQGKFIIFPNKIIWPSKDKKSPWEYNVPNEECDHYITNELVDMDDEMIKAKIIISSEAKEKILEQLKRFGILKNYLFADSVDIVCGEITKSFTDKFKR